MIIIHALAFLWGAFLISLAVGRTPIEFGLIFVGIIAIGWSFT